MKQNIRSNISLKNLISFGTYNVVFQIEWRIIPNFCGSGSGKMIRIRQDQNTKPTVNRQQYINHIETLTSSIELYTIYNTYMYHVWILNQLVLYQGSGSKIFIKHTVPDDLMTILLSCSEIFTFLTLWHFQISEKGQYHRNSSLFKIALGLSSEQ